MRGISRTGPAGLRSSLISSSDAMIMNVGSDDAGEFHGCLKRQRTEFTSYDQLVDVVSCWHSFFDFGYVREGAGVYFDRFPVVGENGLTPDFTMLFSHEYGIIGEVARSIDSSPDVLESKAEQLKKYDATPSFRTNLGGKSVIPKTHDILLLLLSDYSNKGAIALERYWQAAPEKRPKCNVVVMEYNLSSGDAQTKYVFKKMIHDKNGKFRDESIPSKLQLEKTFGIEAQSLRMKPEYFFQSKAVNLFCNDKPPPVYLATRLWDRVFPAMLSGEQLRAWRKGSSTIVQRLPTDSSVIQDLMCNKIVPGCRIRREWIEESLKFLETAGRAERSGSDWQVLFSNLRVRNPRTGASREEASFEKMREYGDLLAETYCQGAIGIPSEMDEDEPEEILQKSLSDFE